MAEKNDTDALMANIDALVTWIGIPTIVATGPDMFGDYNLTPAGETAVLAAVVSNLRDADVVKASAVLMALLWHHAPTFTRIARNHDMWKNQCERQAETITALRTALHDAIARPKGVVPASAEPFYSPAEADRSTPQAHP